MKLLLEKDVDDLGFAGEIVKVKPGYARNFLIPNRFAVPVSKNNLRRVEKLKAETEKRHMELQKNAEAVAEKLAALELVVERRAGEEGKLYGSVTTMDLAEALAKEGYDIQKKHIQIGEPIKTLGEHSVKVKLFKDVSPEIKVVVKAEEKPE